MGAGASFTALSMAGLAGHLGSLTRARAARRWLYDARPLPPRLPERIPGVNAEAWSRLLPAAPLPEWTVVSEVMSEDGTRKLAIALAGGAVVETVLIPSRGRTTVCVSSQSGCSRACTFCATAALGFGRQLDAGEIVLQYVLARALAPADAPARNVVFMGMGEPMDNLDAVMAGVSLLLESPAPGLSAAHVTVSTSGVLPGLRRFLREGRGHLALSLNATTDAQRARVMPHNRTWPIADLLAALAEDQRPHPGRRYFIEYVMWDGFNDTLADADRLAGLLAGLPAHVNLIPHNPTAGVDLAPSPPERVLAFQDRLRQAGLRCLIRWPRGREIAAACGQLAGAGGAARSRGVRATFS